MMSITRNDFVQAPFVMVQKFFSVQVTDVSYVTMMWLIKIDKRTCDHNS